MVYLVLADRINSGLFQRLGDARRWKEELDTYPVNWRQRPSIIAVTGDTAPLTPTLSCFGSVSHCMRHKIFGRKNGG